MSDVEPPHQKYVLRQPPRPRCHLIRIENDCPRDVPLRKVINLCEFNITAISETSLMMHNDVPSTQLGEDLTSALDIETIAVHDEDNERSRPPAKLVVEVDLLCSG